MPNQLKVKSIITKIDTLIKSLDANNLNDKQLATLEKIKDLIIQLIAIINRENLTSNLIYQTKLEEYNRLLNIYVKGLTHTHEEYKKMITEAITSLQASKAYHNSSRR